MNKVLLPRKLNKRKKLEQDLAHISQEMYRRNAELAAINDMLSLLRTIDTLVLGSQDELKVLCNQIARAIIENSEYSWAAIFCNVNSHGHLELLGNSFSSDLSQTSQTKHEHPIFLSVNDDWLKKNSSTHTLKLSHTGPKASAEFLHSTEEFVTNLREGQHIDIVYFVKLMARGSLVGVMAIGFPSNVQEINKDAETLVSRLSDAVGVAIDNKLLFEENQRVVKELQKTNQKLRDLDETKDEFISMASHQLRTPLTTVKGYVSMVLEGDAGKISTNQRKLLDQSFLSAQRMVYLIADLLNVSRLRTGKFVIDATPTNLADVVEGEIAQLVGAAKSRGLELIYDKPKNFTPLMLDETKTRQVIMNFADNAIYYTPSGGHIKVNVSETPESVEFTVVDDGIGVPKAEQHHMFSKFYRAGNAKKARPDGTGLGLFMAKKVVVAQGGAIIFKSEEGKGSTFGFSFPKEKLKVPAHIKPSTAKAKGQPAHKDNGLI